MTSQTKCYLFQENIQNSQLQARFNFRRIPYVLIADLDEFLVFNGLFENNTFVSNPAYEHLIRDHMTMTVNIGSLDIRSRFLIFYNSEINNRTKFVVDSVSALYGSRVRSKQILATETIYKQTVHFTHKYFGMANNGLANDRQSVENMKVRNQRFHPNYISSEVAVVFHLRKNDSENLNKIETANLTSEAKLLLDSFVDYKNRALEREI